MRGGVIAGNLTNKGSLLIGEDGQFALQGTLTNQGTIDVEPSLPRQTGTGEFTLGDQYGTGTIDNAAGATIIFGGQSQQLTRGRRLDDRQSRGPSRSARDRA